MQAETYKPSRSTAFFFRTILRNDSLFFELQLRKTLDSCSGLQSAWYHDWTVDRSGRQHH